MSRLSPFRWTHPLGSVRILLAFTAGLSGCALERGPMVEITAVRLGETSDSAAVLEFDLRLSNPGDERYELLDYHYHLAVDGQRCYTGRHAARASLGPGDERSMTIPAVINFGAVGWASGTPSPRAVEYELAGDLHYTAPGYINEILYDAGLYRPRAGFRERGPLADDGALEEAPGDTAGATSASTPRDAAGAAPALPSPHRAHSRAG